ncbi:flavodoxin family protein [uncultured Methanobrevibacter sp.]|uniref:flavodoxin family protein n=1 Tax=uncultured Methanobrevibacter sp. TaxID=253161 RepID=UPI00260A20FF|nr:flavodoxin family protein [uncultured Methanobrevibacter sp.]
MKYVIINGSPRKKNTWNIINQARKNLNGEFEEIHLASRKIPMCRGCYNCILEGEDKCPHFEYINPIVEKIKEADGFIISSPVYALNVTAILKNFIDHTAYIYHRPEFFDKKALVVVSTAGAGQKKVAKYLNETLRHWGFNKVYNIAIACGGKDHLETEGIDKISKKFGSDVESGKLHSPKFGDVLFYNVWRAMAVTDDPIPADARFWQETGLVNHDFSPAVKLNPLKKIFAKLMYFVFKKVL